MFMGYHIVCFSFLDAKKYSCIGKVVGEYINLKSYFY